MKGLFRSGETTEAGGVRELTEAGNIDDRPKRRERTPAGKDNLNAFIGEGTAFQGKLTFEGTVRVDGRLDGEITTKDTLVVGESAEVRAEIRTGSVVIGGTVHGNVTAANKVELHSGARLFGNISTPSLVVAEGVIFEGTCAMGAKGKAKGAAGPPAAPSNPPPAKAVGGA